MDLIELVVEVHCRRSPPSASPLESLLPVAEWVQSLPLPVMDGERVAIAVAKASLATLGAHEQVNNT